MHWRCRNRLLSRHEYFVYLFSFFHHPAVFKPVGWGYAGPALGLCLPRCKLRVSVIAVTDSARFCGGGFDSFLGFEYVVCSDRILTCRIKSIRSPAKVGLVVTDLITSPVVSWEGWETPPPPPAPRLSCHSLLNHRRGKTSLLLW